MRKFDDAVDRVPVRASPDDAEQMGANSRRSKVSRINPSHRDTSARPTPGPHIGFICLRTLIIHVAPSVAYQGKHSIEAVFAGR